MMDDIKAALLLHLIFGPIDALIMAYDAYHPEVWDTWYRNPAIAIPYCICLEIIIWGMLLIALPKKLRHAKADRLTLESMRLRKQGRHWEADILLQEALRLIGKK